MLTPVEDMDYVGITVVISGGQIGAGDPRLGNIAILVPNQQDNEGGQQGMKFVYISDLWARVGKGGSVVFLLCLCVFVGCSSCPA